MESSINSKYNSMFTPMLFEDDNCKKGRHTFISSKNKFAPRNPKCIYCDANVVDWERVRQRNINDIEFVISELNKSQERYEIWIVEVDIVAKNHALRKGKKELRNYVRKRLSQLIGYVYDTGDPIRRPYRDGYQTPYSGNIVYYAQHATACCCRPCVERWHGIPQGRDLADDELDYLRELTMSYIEQKLPELQEEGVHIPPIRKPKQHTIMEGD
jgi:hypothetical protein